MSMPFYVAVGARVRAIREKAGMSQQDFAAAAGMNPKYAWRVEQGLQNLSLLSIGRAALALGVPPTAFFEGVEVEAALLDPAPRTNARTGIRRTAPA